MVLETVIRMLFSLCRLRCCLNWLKALLRIWMELLEMRWILRDLCSRFSYCEYLIGYNSYGACFVISFCPAYFLLLRHLWFFSFLKEFNLHCLSYFNMITFFVMYVPIAWWGGFQGRTKFCCSPYTYAL